MRADRHPFAPGPGRVPDASGHSWAACRECGRDVRAHPRRSRNRAAPATVETIERSPIARILDEAGAADRRAERVAIVERHRERLGAIPPAEPTPISPMPASFAVELLRHAVDLVLALPIDAIGWRLRLRVLDVKGGLDLADPPLMPELAVVEPPPLVAPEVAPGRTVRVSKRHGSRWIRRMLASSDLWPIAERALDEGWTARREIGGSRIAFLSPNGRDRFRMHASGDTRSYQNAKHDARRAGLDVEGL